MDFIFEAIFWFFRFIVFELLYFGIGYLVLFILTFGICPDKAKLEEERKDYGEFSVMLMLNAPEHFFVGFVGVTFYLIAGFLFYFYSK